MKKLLKRQMTVVVLTVACAASSHVFARDTVDTYAIDPALKSEPGKVGDDVGLYFSGQKHPGVAKSFGEFATNKKTNAFGKSDEAACQPASVNACSIRSLSPINLRLVRSKFLGGFSDFERAGQQARSARFPPA